MLKKKNISYLCFKTQLKSSKKGFSFNDYRWRKMVLSSRNYQLLRGKTSKHYGDFYCLNCLHSFAIENKCESRKNLFENKDFSNVLMPSKDSKIIEFNQYQKYDKVPFVIYADIEYLID